MRISDEDIEKARVLATTHNAILRCPNCYGPRHESAQCPPAHLYAEGAARLAAYLLALLDERKAAGARAVEMVAGLRSAGYAVHEAHCKASHCSLCVRLNALADTPTSDALAAAQAEISRLRGLLADYRPRASDPETRAAADAVRSQYERQAMTDDALILWLAEGYATAGKEVSAAIGVIAARDQEIAQLKAALAAAAAKEH